MNTHPKKLKSLAKNIAGISLITCVTMGCAPREFDWVHLRNENLPDDVAFMEDNIDLPNRPLVLNDILEIGLTRNIDLLVEQRGISIQEKVAFQERISMLPEVLGNAELSGRDKPFGEETVSITGQPTGAVGRDHRTKRWDLSVAFSVVDFGLAYYRSRQEQNRVMQTRLKYERARQTLILDITSEYWKAVTNLKAMNEGRRLAAKAEKQKESLQRLIDKQMISRIDGLRSIDRLVVAETQIASFEKGYFEAKERLGQLMGLPSYISFELAEPDEVPRNVSLEDIEDLELMALKSRSELYTQDIEEQIMVDEAHTALLQMLPNARLFGDTNYDGDSFLLHNNWMSAGVRATWNLINIPRFKANRASAFQQQLLAQETRVALSVAILSQVHISYLNYLDASKRYEKSREQRGVKTEIQVSGANRLAKGAMSETDQFEYEFDRYMADISAFEAYGNQQIALEQINNAIGKPLYFNPNNTYGEDDPWAR